MNYRVRNLWRIAAWVAAAHLVVVAILWVVPWIRARLRRPPPQIIPIELAMAALPPPPPRLPDPVRIPDPRPLPAPDKPTLQPQPVVTNRPPRERPRIEVSQERVERKRDPVAPPEPQPAMTPEQLRELLRTTVASGPSTVVGTATPSADARDYETIRQALYQAWRQPAGHHLRGRITEAALRLDAQGIILEHRVARSSGDEAMDASVRAAVEAVRRIPGLSPGFAARHPLVTIYFQLAE